MAVVKFETWQSTEESSAEDDDAADYAQSQINAAFGGGTISSSGTMSSTSRASSSTVIQTKSTPSISASKPVIPGSTSTISQQVTTSKNANPPPTGGSGGVYSERCKDWDIKDDHLLVATCTDKDGKTKKTQEDLNLCLHYDNGSLIPMDNGQFQHDCEKCLFNPESWPDHSTLWCICKNGNDPFQKSASVTLDDLMTVQDDGDETQGFMKIIETTYLDPEIEQFKPMRLTNTGNVP
ncbi:hypothetical protein F4818DRAFT_441472 [Hypoxylon cercidicola]|nr:hypothetical protein F4818DRAFT_441472 [Hypoxylon cercidicola]